MPYLLYSVGFMNPPPSAHPWIGFRPGFVHGFFPGPPTQYYLGYAYACSLPLKAPPYLRTDKISEPPFRGLFAGFSCLGDPPKSKTLLNVPLIFYFITPFFNFAGVQRERERKTTPFLKEISGWKVKYPPFLQFSGQTLSHEKYPFTGDFGNTHAVPPTPEWGGRFFFDVCCLVGALLAQKRAHQPPRFETFPAFSNPFSISLASFVKMTWVLNVQRKFYEPTPSAHPWIGSQPGFVGFWCFLPLGGAASTKTSTPTPHF